jgi:hypothetical protein
MNDGRYGTRKAVVGTLDTHQPVGEMEGAHSDPLSGSGDGKFKGVFFLKP